MKAFAYIAVAACVVVFAAPSVVRADMAASPWSDQNLPKLLVDRHGPVTAADSLVTDLPDDPLPLQTDLLGGPLSAGVSPLAEAQTPDKVVRELPPAPSSLALFLSALGTLGALRLPRLAGRLHLSHLPAWYHEGAPAQIGHASVLELDCPLMPAWYDQRPDSGTVAPFRIRQWEPPNQLTAQTTLIVAAPRGPPHCIS